MWKWIRKIFRKQSKEMTTMVSEEHDPYAPRRNNVVYPNDRFAHNHINQWLDNVYDKHHG